jgi:DNA sulfur modification protein DndD
MSLHFDSVSLKNFGPYRDVTDLRLTTTLAAPVVLIHGENTLGKTQLFSAIRWCLYGSFEPQQDASAATATLPSRFNKISAREGEEILEVSLTFTANGQHYSLTRRAKCWDGPPRVSADLRIGPAVIQQAAIETEIGRLLHPQISEFFLFDAELMERFYDRLATERERAFIRQSIEQVLGIPALQLAERDLSDLARDAQNRQARSAHSEAEAGRLNRRLRALKTEQESVETNKRELTELLNTTGIELRDLTEKLKTVESLQADIREQEILDAQLNGGEQEDTRLKVEMQQLLGAGWLSVAGAKLKAALATIQRQNSMALQQQVEVNEAQAQVNMLSERTRGGACPTCHQQLPPPTEETRRQLLEAENHLTELLKQTGDLPNLELERKINSLIDETTIIRYREKQNTLNELIRMQYLRRRNRDQISDRLKGHSAVEIRSWAQQQEQLEAVEGRTRKEIAVADRRLIEIRIDQQKTARQLDRLPGAQPQVVLEANFFGYSEALLNRTIERYRERTRETVELNASDMFLRLIRDPQGYGGLQIAPDYQVRLLDMHGHKRDTSEGGKQLVALSLIGALKQAAVRGGPVVLDSPLARLDLDHRASVLKIWVPSLGTQAILLLQSGELTQEAGHEILGPTIAHEYRIVRPTNDPEFAIIERTQ